MTWRVTQITGPAALAVSIDEARAHIRAFSTAEDQQIDGYIRAALAHIEQSSGRCFMPQVLEVALDAFPESALELDPGPAVSIGAVTYYDGATDVVMAVGTYALSAASVISPVAEWPAGSNVRIRYTAGRGSPPADIKQAVLLLAGFYYDNRAAAAPGPSVPIQYGVEPLVSLHRNYYV